MADLLPSERGISPVIGTVLFVVIVVLLAAMVASMVLGLGDRLNDPALVQDDDACPGFEQATFEKGGDDFNDLLQELRDNNCALWLEGGQYVTSGGNASAWEDQGPNTFDAVQSTARQQPAIVHDSDLGRDVLEFDANHSEVDSNDPDSTEGDYLKIERDVDSLGVDEESGLVVVSTLKVENFDRGGVWTIGKAGEDGREFSMRTCSNYSFDGCQHSNPEGEWRGQHWGSADLDFDSGDNSAGEWLILTHAYDGDEVVIRVNGEEVARSSVDLNLSANRDIQIGRWERTSGDPDYYFDGRIAEVTIFDRELTTSEIEAVEEYQSDEYGIALNGPIGNT